MVSHESLGVGGVVDHGDEGGGRVWTIGRAVVRLRLRGVPILHGCHWINAHVLCGGVGCAACEVGWPKRAYSFWWCDSPGESPRLLRATPTDAAKLEELATQAGCSFAAGLVFTVNRPVDRRPLSFANVVRPSEMTPHSPLVIQRAVLTLHGCGFLPLESSPEQVAGSMRARAESAVAQSCRRSRL